MTRVLTGEEDEADEGNGEGEGKVGASLLPESVVFQLWVPYVAAAGDICVLLPSLNLAENFGVVKAFLVGQVGFEEVDAFALKVASSPMVGDLLQVDEDVRLVTNVCRWVVGVVPMDDVGDLCMLASLVFSHVFACNISWPALSQQLGFSSVSLIEVALPSLIAEMDGIEYNFPPIEVELGIVVQSRCSYPVEVDRCFVVRGAAIGCFEVAGFILVLPAGFVMIFF
ncbi:hypothetical protein SUGI_0454830 [Cryptomeria japonica]|nr:hypothetical protein SUGI_0454830 [Cryptomeria japonica]